MKFRHSWSHYIGLVSGLGLTLLILKLENINFVPTTSGVVGHLLINASSIALCTQICSTLERFTTSKKREKNLYDIACEEIAAEKADRT